MAGFLDALVHDLQQLIDAVGEGVPGEHESPAVLRPAAALGGIGEEALDQLAQLRGER